MFTDQVDIISKLGTDRDDGCRISTGSLDETSDLIILSGSFPFLHQIDLILQDNDILQLHDLDSSQVLQSLWLWAWLIPCT